MFLPPLPGLALLLPELDVPGPQAVHSLHAPLHYVPLGELGELLQHQLVQGTTMSEQVFHKVQVYV